MHVRTRLERGHVAHRRPQRHCVIGVGLHGHEFERITTAPLREAVNQRAIDLASLDITPGFVERPCGIHFNVALTNCWHRSDCVDTGNERERSTKEIVETARAHKVDVSLGNPRLRDGFAEYWHDDLNFVVLNIARHRRSRVANNPYFPHEMRSAVRFAASSLRPAVAVAGKNRLSHHRYEYVGISDPFSNLVGA